MSPSDRARSASPGRNTQRQDDSYSSRPLERNRGRSPERHRGRSPDSHRGRSPNRSDRNHDRSRSRTSFPRDTGPSVERTWESARTQFSGPKDELPYLPPADYLRFKSEVLRAKEELCSRFFKSSTPPKRTEHVRSATSDQSMLDDALSDAEIYALRASVSGPSDDFSDYEEDDSTFLSNV